MNKRESGVALAFVLGAVLMLAASPASALCGFQCTCNSGCNDYCTTGPDIPDCPGCNETTCGNWGICVDLCQTGSCQATSCTSTLNGTSSGDTLNGNSNHQCINGLGGADTISGEAGDDTISAGSGNDTVYGGSGNDCMYGDDGDDNLTGDTGSFDYADGGTGTDTCTAETEISCT